jgi:hypothetical protein
LWASMASRPLIGWWRGGGVLPHRLMMQVDISINPHHERGTPGVEVCGWLTPGGGVAGVQLDAEYRLQDPEGKRAGGGQGACRSFRFPVILFSSCSRAVTTTMIQPSPTRLHRSYTHKHAYVCAYVHAPAHAPHATLTLSHTHMHTHTHLRARVGARAHTHTRTHTYSCWPTSPPGTDSDSFWFVCS